MKLDEDKGISMLVINYSKMKVKKYHIFQEKNNSNVILAKSFCVQKNSEIVEFFNVEQRRVQTLFCK